MRCTSERCSATGARSTCLATVSILSPLSSATGRFQNQSSHSVARQRGGFEICAALEAMRSIGVQTVAPRSLAHRRRIEPCRLDQDVAGLLGDHGVEPAHDAGERDRLFRVGDDQVFRRQLALHSVQRLEGFAAERPPHQNLAAFEQIEIEDVGGVSHLP